jgi:hypothetical protein
MTLAQNKGYVPKLIPFNNGIKQLKDSKGYVGFKREFLKLMKVFLLKFN